MALVNLGAGLKYKAYTDSVRVYQARENRYLESLKAFDFSRSPDLRRYFSKDFFLDAEIRKCEFIDLTDLLLELEAFHVWFYIGAMRKELGLAPLERINKGEAIYTCRFKNVASFSTWCDFAEIIYRKGRDAGGYSFSVLSKKFHSDPPYQFSRSEVMDSHLRRSLMKCLKRHLFHLRFLTIPARTFDIVFEKVIVTRQSKEKYEKYTAGKKVTFPFLCS